jgi:dihydrofolate reductase
MTLIYDTSMSLDGFITGPSPQRGVPLGEGGEQLHEWMAGIADFRYRYDAAAGTNVDAQVRDELHRRTGAILIGRTMFDVGEEPWGADPPFASRVFIVTHRPRPPETKEGGTSYTFVTEGIEAALEQAQAAAGDKDIVVIGGANLARQYLDAGLLDEVQIHLVPVLLGRGVRLFDGTGQVALAPTRVIHSDVMTHLSYRVSNEVLDDGNGRQPLTLGATRGPICKRGTTERRPEHEKAGRHREHHARRRHRRKRGLVLARR